MISGPPGSRVDACWLEQDWINVRRCLQILFGCGRDSETGGKNGSWSENICAVCGGIKQETPLPVDTTHVVGLTFYSKDWLRCPSSFYKTSWKWWNDMETKAVRNLISNLIYYLFNPTLFIQQGRSWSRDTLVFVTNPVSPSWRECVVVVGPQVSRQLGQQITLGSAAFWVNQKSVSRGWNISGMLRSPGCDGLAQLSEVLELKLELELVQ